MSFQIAEDDGIPTRAQSLRMRRWYNDGDSTCPGFGYIQLPPFEPGDKLASSYKTVVGGEKVIKGRAKNDYGYNHRKLRMFAINGPTPVKAGEVGQLHQHYPCVVGYPRSRPSLAGLGVDRWLE